MLPIRVRFVLTTTVAVIGCHAARPAATPEHARISVQTLPAVPIGGVLTGKVAGVISASADTAPRVACTTRCRALPAPLYVIDGVIAGRTTPPTMERAFIDTIVVLRGVEALRRYGDEGRDGVVEITMLRPDTGAIATLAPELPLSARQAAVLCARSAPGTPLAVIDGRVLGGDRKTESKWPELEWSEVIRRDYYTPDEAMAEFGKAGRFGAFLYTSRYAGTADSSIRRRPPTNHQRIIIRGVQALAAADTEPVIVINDLVVTRGDSTLEDVNANDVEDIEVVGCPLAVMRFGRRARRGAVLVTLKPGTAFPRRKPRP